MATAAVGFGAGAAAGFGPGVITTAGGAVTTAPAGTVGTVSATGVRRLGEYELLEKLGSGLQGKVYKARGSDGKLYALKLIDQDSVRASAKVFTNLQREIAAMERVAGHAHVIGVHRVEYDVMKPRKKRPAAYRRCIMIVMELATNGELFDYLMLAKFPEGIARAYMAQLLEVRAAAAASAVVRVLAESAAAAALSQALHHCHSKDVVHRDIKPENLLLDGDFQLRVADWGLSAVLEDVDSAALRTQCGTRAYMAPEVLRREAYRGRAVDIWSAGVVLFIMLAGFPPFEQAAAGDWWYDRIAHGQHSLFWAAHERTVAFSPEAKAFLDAIFVADPARRISVDDALKHPWMAGEVPPHAALAAEMHSRRLRILANKGLPVPAGDGGVAAAEEDVEMAGSYGSDVFTAGTATRGVAAETTLPSRKPRLLGAGAGAAAADAKPADAGAGLAVAATPAIADDAGSMLLAGGDIATHVAIPDSVLVEALPADFDGATRVGWFAISAAATPVNVARSLAKYFEEARAATVAVRGTDTALKLRAVVPTRTSAPLQADVRIFSVPEGVAGTRGIPAGSRFVVTLQRVLGDTLALATIFAGLQRAYSRVLAVASESEVAGATVSDSPGLM